MRSGVTIAQRVASGVKLAARSVYDYAIGLGYAFVGSPGHYPSTDPKRKILEDWRPRPATANRAIAPSLTALVAQGRHLDRGTPVYRSMVEGRKSELVGTGIGIDPDTGDTKLNQILKDGFAEFAECAGTLDESLWSLQRMASGEVDNAGAFLWRKLILPERVDQGFIPFTIQALEVEYLTELPVVPVDEGNRFVRGAEIDKLGRLKYVHLRNPDEHFGTGERVAASEIHLGFERRRAAMALGEPRLCSLIERNLQDDELVLSELKAARNTSGMSVVISSDELAAAMNGVDDEDAPLPPTTIQTGGIAYTPSTTEVTPVSHTRPSSSVKEFRSTLKGDMAGGASISRVWLDRDGAAYNFANSKFDQIRTQMVVRPAHDWFGRGVASWPYEQAVPWILLRAGVPWPKDKREQRRLLKHKIIPDVPPELDEKAAAEGFEKANGQGITSRKDFLAARGKDIDQVDKDRKDEQARADQLAVERILAIQAKIAEANKADPSLKLHWSHVVTMGGASSAPGAYLQAAAGAASAQSGGAKDTAQEQAQPPKDVPA
jgi:capsid protein